MSKNRTYNLGRLSELAKKMQQLRVKVDASVKALLYHFDPIDSDLEYVERIKPERLEIYVDSIRKEVCELKKIRTEIESLKSELGESDGG